MSNAREKFEEFIGFTTSNATRWTYKSSLKRFFQTIYGTVYGKEPKLAEAQLFADIEKYFSEKRNYEEDVKAFFISIKDNPPKTIQTWLSIVRNFLLENKKELPQYFWKKLRRRVKGSRAVTEDFPPSNEQLRQIVTHMTAKGKALFLMMASSGMRIRETLKLKIEDVDFDVSPTRINVKAEYTKTGTRRWAWISDEATEALKEWLKVRNREFETAIARSTLHEKSPDDDNRIFPFEKPSAYEIWNNALDSAQLNGIDKTTMRHKFHPQTLRKFCRSRLGTVLTEDLAEALIGHEGYLTAVYRKYSVEQLAEFYQKAEHTLSVYGVSDGQTAKKVSELEQSLGQATFEKDTILKRLQALEEQMKRYDKALEGMEHTIRTFQIETLKRQGNTPEQIREMMEKVGSRKEEYLD
jgi:integrase